MTSSTIVGPVLVALQFVIAAVLVIACPMPPATWTLPIFFIASGIAIWAWVTMGFRRIRILPGVTDKTQLVTSGPYRFIRHPMYAGLMLLTLATLPNDFSIWKFVLWIALTCVLVAKSVIEERVLVDAFPQYHAYQDDTYAMIPGCW